MSLFIIPCIIYASSTLAKGGLMVSLLAMSVVDHGLKPWSGQTNDYNIGICYFSVKQAQLRS
jgi:hypothetical protein